MSFLCSAYTNKRKNSVMLDALVQCIVVCWWSTVIISQVGLVVSTSLVADSTRYFTNFWLILKEVSLSAICPADP